MAKSASNTTYSPRHKHHGLAQEAGVGSRGKLPPLLVVDLDDLRLRQTGVATIDYRHDTLR